MTVTISVWLLFGGCLATCLIGFAFGMAAMAGPRAADPRPRPEPPRLRSPAPRPGYLILSPSEYDTRPFPSRYR